MFPLIKGPGTFSRTQDDTNKSQPLNQHYHPLAFDTMAPPPRSLLPLLLLVCFPPSTPTTLNPRILADINRDAVVSDLDNPGKYNWTVRRGAIFLPNIGDSDHRCPVVDLTGAPLSNDELWHCHDASGDRLLPPSAHYAAPLLTLPLSNISDDAVGYIYIEPANIGNWVRLFWNETDWSTGYESVWSVVNHQVTFNATSLRKGISLAIDGRELVTDDAVWDGSVKVVFEVTDGNQTERGAQASPRPVTPPSPEGQCHP